MLPRCDRQPQSCLVAASLSRMRMTGIGGASNQLPLLRVVVFVARLLADALVFHEEIDDLIVVVESPGESIHILDRG